MKGRDGNGSRDGRRGWEKWKRKEKGYVRMEEDAGMMKKCKRRVTSGEKKRNNRQKVKHNGGGPTNMKEGKG